MSPTGKKLFLFVRCGHGTNLDDLTLVYAVDGFNGQIIKRRQDAVVNGRQVESPSHLQLANLALAELAEEWRGFKEREKRAMMIAKATEGAPKPMARP